MRVIHIGVGVRGRQWLQIVRDHPGVTSVGCVDPDLSALAAVRREFPNLANACFSRIDDTAARVAADAAIIATPPAGHVRDCLEALEAGWAVMVEKPFTLDVEEGQRVVARARARKRAVLVAQNYRFAPAERTVRDVIRRGLLGPITWVTCHARRRRPGAGTSMEEVSYAQVLEAGVHHFDSLRSMLGKNAVSIAASVGNTPGSGYRHGAITTALIDMEDGVPIEYVGTLTSHRDEYHLRVEGLHGALTTDGKRVWLRKKGARVFWPVRSVPVPKGDASAPWRRGTASLLNILRAALVDGREAETSGLDNLQTIAMVEAVKRSTEERRRVEIREILDGVPA
jgi:predicted dehydrogenase